MLKSGDGALLPTLCATTFDQRRSARGDARAALQPAQGDLRPVRTRHAADRGLARIARGRGPARRLWEDLHRGERGHRSDQHRRGFCRWPTAPIRSTTCISLPIAPPDMGRNPGRAAKNSTILIDATLKHSAPPLPSRREFMERAQTIWEELAAAITPQPPWHGYSLGDWSQLVGLCANAPWRASGSNRRGNVRPATRRIDPRDAGARGRKGKESKD